MDQAGGIGGLLMLRDHASGTYHFVGADGNGNVVSLVNASDTSVSARYEFSAFGETIRMTGAIAPVNPFRFSTKYSDDETALDYYGYRYYQPLLGRWLGRDPIGEDGGVNLYAFVFNNPATGIDTLGDVAIWVTDDLRIDADDARGAHVHDYGNDVSYAFGADRNGDPSLTALKGHENEFNFGRAQDSLRGIMQNREAYQALKTANSSLWRRAGATAGRITRATVRATGKAIKIAGRAAGVACAVLAIVQAAEGAMEVGDALADYAKDAKNGDAAMLDLDAVAVAVGVQDMTGNYFITTDVLGILLQ